ncbi:Putative asparaginase/glutaminase, L-asparaginase, asparaginase/glutaminase, active site 2 [Colletotrichum destructivum]|uniref:asparaginase n=1 Tax=Colletotrichum destructivum TaxID=34406 RepID=A0AAX4IC43_9PEZI|nr:Putative asparaginase/glutaminase, L-asparaginase, asparaginase/glutaminase, active site 2 [Colletotrichum destructivum]
MQTRNLLLAASNLALGLAAPASPPAPLPAYNLLSSRETHFNASLPNITIFATGGTIAGSAASNAQTTGYQAGALGVDILIDAVPELRNVSNVSGVQVANVDSGSITPAILLNLTRLVQEALDDPYCQGAVVTHGTDTLEESAFFLQLAVRSEKPVVVVGAMRPATAISADGPINLLEAVTLAASPDARGRGTMVVLNDRIGSAFYTSKTHANSLDTFRAVEQGYLGFFLDIKPVFYYPPVLPLGHVYFNVSAATELPQVDILFGHQALNPAIAKAAVESGAKGLVLAGMGAGGWTTPGREALKTLAQENNTHIVVSSRTMGGFVEDSDAPNTYGGWNLNPQKARIMLQLALYSGYVSEQLETLFKYAP